MKGIPNDSELLHKREEELKHAQDVRELYEEKLQTADKLYNDLKSCKSHLEAKEMELQRLVGVVWVWCASGSKLLIIYLFCCCLSLQEGEAAERLCIQDQAREDRECWNASIAFGRTSLGPSDL